MSSGTLLADGLVVVVINVVWLVWLWSDPCIEVLPVPGARVRRGEAAKVDVAHHDITCDSNLTRT